MERRHHHQYQTAALWYPVSVCSHCTAKTPESSPPCSQISQRLWHLERGRSIPSAVGYSLFTRRVVSYRDGSLVSSRLVCGPNVFVDETAQLRRRNCLNCSSQIAGGLNSSSFFFPAEDCGRFISVGGGGSQRHGPSLGQLRSIRNIRHSTPTGNGRFGILEQARRSSCSRTKNLFPTISYKSPPSSASPPH